MKGKVGHGSNSCGHNTCCCSDNGIVPARAGSWMDATWSPSRTQEANVRQTLGGNVCPAHAQCATFVFSILAPAPILSPPREVPQEDRTGPQTFPAHVGGMATKPLPSQGSPIEGDKIRNGYITCVLGGR